MSKFSIIVIWIFAFISIIALCSYTIKAYKNMLYEKSIFNFKFSAYSKLYYKLNTLYNELYIDNNRIDIDIYKDELVKYRIYLDFKSDNKVYIKILNSSNRKILYLNSSINSDLLNVKDSSIVLINDKNLSKSIAKCNFRTLNKISDILEFILNGNINGSNSRYMNVYYKLVNR